MPEFVKMVNKNDKPFDFHQSNRKRILQPNEDAIVPWGLACSLFGHPSTLNVHPANERDKLYAKVRGKHNHTLGIVPPEALEMGIRNAEEWWERIKPRIEVYDIETNERVYMVIEDPQGEHMSQPPKSVAGSQDIAMLMSQIQVLTQQVHKLTAAQQATLPDPGQGSTQSPTPTADAGPQGPQVSPSYGATPGGFDIPVSHEDQAPAMDLASIAAQVAAAHEANSHAPGPVEASPDDPQAVASGDIPPKMPPRPGT